MISKVIKVRDALQELEQQATDEQSQFQWQIKSALMSVENITKTYNEVLARDIKDDNPYIPEVY